MSATDLPSMRVMMSPARMPARAAGVSSIGEMTRTPGVLRHFKPEAAEGALSAFSHVLVALDVEELE